MALHPAPGRARCRVPVAAAAAAWRKAEMRHGDGLQSINRPTTFAQAATCTPANSKLRPAGVGACSTVHALHAKNAMMLICRHTHQPCLQWAVHAACDCLRLHAYEHACTRQLHLHDDSTPAEGGAVHEVRRKKQTWDRAVEERGGRRNGACKLTWRSWA